MKIGSLVVELNINADRLEQALKRAADQMRERARESLAETLAVMRRYQEHLDSHSVFEPYPPIPVKPFLRPALAETLARYSPVVNSPFPASTYIRPIESEPYTPVPEMKLRKFINSEYRDGRWHFLGSESEPYTPVPEPTEDDILEWLNEPIEPEPETHTEKALAHLKNALAIIIRNQDKVKPDLPPRSPEPAAQGAGEPCPTCGQTEAHDTFSCGHLTEQVPTTEVCGMSAHDARMAVANNKEVVRGVSSLRSTYPVWAAWQAALVKLGYRCSTYPTQPRNEA